jgi:hypothetical protein
VILDPDNLFTVKIRIPKYAAIVSDNRDPNPKGRGYILGKIDGVMHIRARLDVLSGKSCRLIELIFNFSFEGGSDAGAEKVSQY